MNHSLRRCVVSLLVVLGLTATVAAQETPAGRAPWSERTLELFARLPVQDGGRVKPLDTYAQFRLLRLNAKRKLETPAGEKLGPTAWLLDCLFFPELASTYRNFLVRDQAVLDVIGVRVPDRKKSDRYSYLELLPGRQKLFDEASRIHSIDPKQRNGLESQIYNLALDVRDFADLAHGLDFTRADLRLHESPVLRAHFGAEPVQGLSRFLGGMHDLSEHLDTELAKLSEDEREAEKAAIEEVSHTISQAVESSSAFAIFPPHEREAETWLFTAGAAEVAFTGEAPEIVELLAGWEAMERAKHDPAAFESALSALSVRVTGLAERRGEYAKIPLEVRFYEGDYFTRALVSFLGAFLLLAGSWLAPRQRWLVTGTWGLTALGTVLVVVGVVLRCIIRERPPVSTLYETILFITGCICIVLLTIEWMQRGRIALALAPIMGAAGMFLSMKYELKEAALNGDTMPSLVAVLDTNFWLATHVTSITLGYAAGLLAAALGNLWLLGKMVGLRRGDKDFYKTVSRMTYGVVCFGLIFSVVGTILGGIWANYSWGRFWGWDPKENGALLICLAQLLTLHLRMGGYIREHGIAAMSALNGMVVAFSWWHVNNLGVGLHSYGKTEGVLLALYTYYGLALLIVIASLVWKLGPGAAQAKAQPTAS